MEERLRMGGGGGGLRKGTGGLLRKHHCCGDDDDTFRETDVRTCCYLHNDQMILTAFCNIRERGAFVTLLSRCQRMFSIRAFRTLLRGIRSSLDLLYEVYF